MLAYELPERVVLSCDIGPTWQVESDPEKSSEAEVRFIAETPERTRSSSSTAASTADNWEGLRDGAASTDGWPLYLQRYGEMLD